MTLPIRLQQGSRWFQAILLFCLCLAGAYSIPQREKPKPPTTSPEKPSPAKLKELKETKAGFYHPTSNDPLKEEERKKEKADDKAQWRPAVSEAGKPEKYLGMHFRFKLGEKDFCQSHEFESNARGQLLLRGNVKGYLILVSNMYKPRIYRDLRANQLADGGKIEFARKEEFLVVFSANYPGKLVEKIKDTNECAKLFKDPERAKLLKALDVQMTGTESLVCDDSNTIERGNYIVGKVSETNKQLAFRIIPKFKA